MPNAGSVHFKDVPGGRGTQIKVELQYAPPGGSVGAFVARAFGENPSSQIREDLRRLKTRLEAGVLPSTDGQPIGAQTPLATRLAAVFGQRFSSKDEVATSSEQSFPASDAPAYTH